MFPFLLPLPGAGAGGLIDKRKPLRGTLLGAAAGAVPGLLAAPTASAATNPALIESAAGLSTHGISSASPLGLGGLLGYAKPIGEAALAANAVNGLMQPRQTQAPQMMPQQQGPDPIAGLLAQQQQLEEMRRKARTDQMGMFYGRVA